MDLDLIDVYFPFDTYRPGQREAIESVIKSFDSGKKYVFLEAPAGIGKSAIAYTIAKCYSNVLTYTYYLTSTKILQSQLKRDFKDDKDLAVLKGRNAYPCTYWQHAIKDAMNGRSRIRKSLIEELSKPDFKFNCNYGYCKLVRKKAKLQECADSNTCVYWRNRDLALKSKICVMNFDSFLYQTQHSDFNQVRGFMVADEAHNVEGKLLDFVSITISDRLLDIKMKEQKTPEEYMAFFEKIGLHDHIRQKAAEAFMADKIKKQEQLDSMLDRLNSLSKEVNNREWVCNFVRHDKHCTVELKPIYVKKYFKPLVAAYADRVLFMSATILSERVMMDSLGVKPKDAAFFRLDSNFPPESRPIYFEPVGSLSFKNRDSTFPKLIQKVDEICKNHPDEKGIIHTHNFQISKLLMENCKSSRRFLFQKNFEDKSKMLKVHSESSNTVIVAPAMHEGLDLIGDLSRFQIICKIPYPNHHANPQLKKRSDINWDYYIWITALKIVQSYGRSIRTEVDYADTYVLDSDFKRFLQMSVDILPDWFLEALKL